MIGYSEIKMTEHFVVKTGFCNNAFSKSPGFCIVLRSENFRWALESEISEERARLPASMVFPDELLRAMCSHIKF